MQKTLICCCCIVFATACGPEDNVLPAEFPSSATTELPGAEGKPLADADPVSCVRTLRSFGAQARADVDDTEAMKRAFDSGCTLDGEGLTYRVHGELRMSQPELRAATFVDNGTGDIPLSLQLYDTDHIRLDSLTLDRGTNPEVGEIGRARTLDIQRAQDVQLGNLTFYGHGRGTALSLIDVEQGSVDDVVIRDMGWRNDDFYKEQLVGMWLQRTENVKIQRATIRNLYELREDGSPFTQETDGITFGNSTSFEVRDCFIQNVGEGIDITGSDGNTNFEVSGCVVMDAYAYGIKCSNSAYHGKIYDSEVYRAGYAGFVFEGPSEENLPVITSNILVYDCKAYDTGSNGQWPRSKRSGFLVQKNKYKQDYPRNIEVYHCLAVDRQDRKTMMYGFYNEIENASNRAQHNDSYGHTIEGEDGFN